MSNNSDIEKILQSYKSINLEQIKTVSLMNRIDTKYVFHRSKLPLLLERAMPKYEILNINDHLSFTYYSEYFDTEENQMYVRHHNGIQSRFKIRIREYVESQTRFLEIKNRNNKKKTDKTRMLIGDRHELFSEEESRFIAENSPYDATQLQRSIVSNFRRITLANREWKERITIDTVPEFIYKDKKVCLDDLIICEVKKEPGQYMTPMEHLLRDLRIKPFRISKYCLGTALLKNDVKSNLFKEKLIIINKKLKNEFDQ